MGYVSLREWNKTYHEVKKLGQSLADSWSTVTEDGEKVSPLQPLTPDEQIDLEIRIKQLLTRSTLHLHIRGIRPKEPLWQFNIDDPTTHKSSKKFAYRHLIWGE